ncbi:MAG TPA: hypothetical protein PK661_05140 [Syntrophorhabdaceae bacterium]|jgi:hypothetical protein|nr:hypothetical protein [Pseudomonadota bacterium]HOS59463.1 hypothetical protein [Syntrophorhabdaceae bacterium]
MYNKLCALVSENFIAVSFVGTAIFIIILYIVVSIKKDRKRYKNWLSYPTANEYMSMYLGKNKNRGIACYNCGSQTIWRYRVGFGKYGYGYYHQCHKCSKWLYRSND